LIDRSLVRETFEKFCEKNNLVYEDAISAALARYMWQKSGVEPNEFGVSPDDMETILKI
jgi:hypothetical protein